MGLRKHNMLILSKSCSIKEECLCQEFCSQFIDLMLLSIARMFQSSLQCPSVSCVAKAGSGHS